MTELEGYLNQLIIINYQLQGDELGMDLTMLYQILSTIYLL